MLPTQLIKKGCIVSFISLLLLTAVLYFVVYKTLVVESFGSLNQIGEALKGEMNGLDKAVYAHYFTKRTADQADDDDTPCGPDKDANVEPSAIKYDTQSGTQENACSKLINEEACIATVRIKEKSKARAKGCFGDELALYADHDGDKEIDRYATCPSGAPAEMYDDQGRALDYKTRYNIYPCSWTGSECVQDGNACGVVSDSGYAYRVNNVPSWAENTTKGWTPDTTADVESQRKEFRAVHTPPIEE
tara:strand:- start:1838 stop:2578 length:741 start_codon:yes stop_codon:yes gene_type:complete